MYEKFNLGLEVIGYIVILSSIIVLIIKLNRFIKESYSGYSNLIKIYRGIAISLSITFFLILIVMFISFNNGNNEAVISLLPAFGIILSAAIASASVLLSIENTNNIEKEKKEKELELLKNKLTIYLLEINRVIFLYQSCYIGMKKNEPRFIHTNLASKRLKDTVYKELIFIKNLIITDNKFISTYDGKKISNILRTLTSIEMFFDKFDETNDNENFLFDKSDELLAANFVVNGLIKLINTINNELKLDLDIQLSKVINNIDKLETLNPKELK